MTDVPFTTISVLATLLLARSLLSGSIAQLALGTVLASAAVLSRQLALCIPLAFAAVSFLHGRSESQRKPRAVIPLVACMGALLVYDHWLAATGRVPALYHEKTNDLVQVLSSIQMLATHLPINTFTAANYLGLFLLPVLIPLSADALRGGRRAVSPFVAGLILMAAGEAARIVSGKHALMPLAGNILIPSGIGPLSLRDEWILHLNHVPALPTPFWDVVTALALLGGALLIGLICSRTADLAAQFRRRRRIGDDAAVGTLCLLVGLIYLVPLAISTGPFDRYYVPAIPFFAAGLGGLSGPFDDSSTARTHVLRTCAFALVGAAMLFAVGATRDYLTWNRVRWHAIDELTRDAAADRKDLDGGFEFNGMYLYDPQYHEDATRSWWWVDGDTYQISFGPVPGYSVSKQYSYRRWLPWSKQSIYVLRKDRG
jgi:hypothetical protein